MERNHLLHRDIKPDNIFKAGHNYKLGDLGFSCLDTNKFLNPKRETLNVGSPNYMSPEALRYC